MLIAKLRRPRRECDIATQNQLQAAGETQPLDCADGRQWRLLDEFQRLVPVQNERLQAFSIFYGRLHLAEIGTGTEVLPTAPDQYGTDLRPRPEFGKDRKSTRLNSSH